MKKFQTMGELIAYMVGANAPNELQTAAKNDMQAVEEVNQSGATAFLIIAETKGGASSKLPRLFYLLYFIRPVNITLFYIQVIFTKFLI